MQLSLQKRELSSYVSAQLNNFYPDKNIVDFNSYSHIIDLALDRLDYCFQRVSLAKYNYNGQTLFNHLYSDQYILFIWFLANTIWQQKEDDKIASKLYYLNKTLHAFDCMYDTKLPDIFLIFHGAGTVLGKASYSDFFVALHGCTIGAHNGKYPVLEQGVALTAHSAIVGDCNIGNFVSISNYTTVFQKNIPDNTVVHRNDETGKLVLRSTENAFAKRFFK